MQPRLHAWAPVLRPAFSQPPARSSDAGLVSTLLGLAPFQARVVMQVLLATAAPLTLLAMGKAYYAGKCFWGLFGLLLAWSVVRFRPAEALALTVALTPAINLFRANATYNIVVILFAAVLLFHVLRWPAAAGEIIRRFRLLPGLVLYGSVYYALSFLNTRDYSMNLRFLELAFAGASVLLLGRNRLWLRAALLGLTLSAAGIGGAMLPNYFQSQTGARLGMMDIGEHVLGSPTQLGIPLALSFLALVMDRGQWVNLQRKPLWRLGLLAPVLVLLALTASRAAWGVAGTGLLTSMLIGQRQRFRILLVMAAGVIGLQLLLMSPWGSSLQRGLERTFSPERTAAQRSSGRTDQWRVAYYAFNQSPQTRLIGYGPGRGPALYAQYSKQLQGINYAVGVSVAFHSLFMQVAVETGLLGLGLVLAALVFISLKAWQWTHRHRLLFPLVAFLGYLFMVLTASGNDTVSGVLLGMGIGCTARAPRFRQTVRRWTPAT